MTTQEQRDRLALTVLAHRYREVHGEEALAQTAHSWFAKADNRGRLTFGKTELDHLRRRYQNADMPLWLRIVDYAKVHARYPRGDWAPGMLVFEPQPGELADVLLKDPPGTTDAKRKQIQRAIQTAKDQQMLARESTAARLVLLPGEWSTRAAHTARAARERDTVTGGVGHTVSHR